MEAFSTRGEPMGADQEKMNDGWIIWVKYLTAVFLTQTGIVI